MKNDTLYVVESSDPIDRKETVTARYPIDSDKMKMLKNTVENTDSLGRETDLCTTIAMGWPRFFIVFNDNGRKKNGFLANVYRERFFVIVDIFNDIYPEGDVISYKKRKLIRQEKRCKKKQLKGK